MKLSCALLGSLALTVIAPAAWAETPLPPQGSPSLPVAFIVPPAPLGPRTLPHDDDQPIPLGYHPAARFRTGLIIGGAATFGTTYIVTAVGAAGTSDKTAYIPIVGPFILAARAEGPVASLAVFILALDGLAQAAGATMLITGLAYKKQELVRNDIVGATVRVTPLTMGYGGMGIGIVGEM